MSKTAPGPNKARLDKIDRRILAELQKDGRISYTELANRVALTTSPCIERVRSLREKGYISGYSVCLDPQMFNLNMVVFIQVRLAVKTKATFDEFRQIVAQLPEVQECFLVTGEFDFLIKVRVADMSTYKEFLEEKLLAKSGVQGSTSIVVMDAVKESNAIPIE